MCGCKKVTLGDDVNTSTTHSDAKRTHDWAVGQQADLFRTTTSKVRTTRVALSRGHRWRHGFGSDVLPHGLCRISLVVHLCLTNERFGSSSNPSLYGGLHDPAAADIDQLLAPLNETAVDKLRDHRSDYTR